MVTRKHTSRLRWPADVTSMIAGVAAPVIILIVAEVVTIWTVLLIAVWMVMPLYAGKRVAADVRYGLAWWSASRAGARHARRFEPLLRRKKLWERDNRARLAGVTQGGNRHRVR